MIPDGFSPSQHGNYRRGAGPLRAQGGDCGHGSEVLIARSLTASGQRLDGDSDNFIPDLAFACQTQDRRAANGHNATLIAHTLRADGFDASEDGTGRGTPLVPAACIPIDLRQASRGEKLTNNRANGSGGPPGVGVGKEGDPAFTVSERGQSIAFNWQAGGKQTSLGFNPDVGTAGVQHAGQHPAIAQPLRGNPYNNSDPGMEARMHMVTSGGVRRLTPRECERLQGFPDDWTLVPYRGKPMADGPRYRMLGNSMAVPVMAWLGRRIAMVEATP